MGNHSESIRIEHRGRPSTTPALLLRDKNLSVYAKVVWGILDTWKDPHPGLTLLTEFVPCARATLVNAIQELKTAGWITVIQGNRRSGQNNTYILNHDGPVLDSPDELKRGLSSPDEFDAVNLKNGVYKDSKVSGFKKAVRKPSPRAQASYPQDWYNEPLELYMQLTGIKLQANEFLAPRGWLKSCYMAGHPKDDVLNFMRWLAQKNWPNWTLLTVQQRMAQWKAGKLIAPVDLLNRNSKYPPKVERPPTPAELAQRKADQEALEATNKALANGWIIGNEVFANEADYLAAKAKLEEAHA